MRLFASAFICIFGGCCLQGSEIRTTQLSQDASGLGHRKWENGYLAAWRAVDSSVAPQLLLFDRNGAKLWSRTLALPGALKTFISTVAIWPDGAVTVSCGATAADGTLAAFLALLGKHGELLLVEATTPFVAWHMKVAPSGSLWAFGRAQSIPGAKQAPAHNTLRQFTREGKQLLESFPDRLFPAWPHPAVGAELILTGDRVGLLLGASPEWIEVSPSTGEILARKPVPAPAGIRVRGAALAPGGSIYVSGSVSPHNSPPQPLFAEWNPNTGAWTTLLHSLPEPAQGAVIIGSHEGSLLLSNASPQLHWFPVR